MSELSKEKDPVSIIVFDNRQAKGPYVDFDYYRGASFDVPPGYVGVLQLTTHDEVLPNIMFTVVRMAPLNPCFDKESPTGVGKAYRRWRCHQWLGDDGDVNGQPSDFTSYNKAVVRLGYDNRNQRLVEHEYIVHPGTYYVLADKATNPELEDCSRPTLIDMSLMPICCVPELALPCVPSDGVSGANYQPGLSLEDTTPSGAGTG